jgi:hypothetical protein
MPASAMCERLVEVVKLGELVGAVDEQWLDWAQHAGHLRNATVANRINVRSFMLSPQRRPSAMPQRIASGRDSRGSGGELPRPFVERRHRARGTQGCGPAGMRAAHSVTRSARWASELPRCSGGNGGNPMSSRTESEHADQSYESVTVVLEGPAGVRS